MKNTTSVATAPAPLPVPILNDVVFLFCTEAYATWSAVLLGYGLTTYEDVDVKPLPNIVIVTYPHPAAAAVKEVIFPAGDVQSFRFRC